VPILFSILTGVAKYAIALVNHVLYNCDQDSVLLLHLKYIAILKFIKFEKRSSEFCYAKKTTETRVT